MKEMRSENPATIREWDRLAIEEYGIPGIALMENAGAGAARIISGLSEKDCPPPFVILCGPGNNGGDGYVVARHLCNSGFEVEVCLCFAPESLDRTSDAGVNLGVIERMGIPTSCPGEAGPGRLLKRAAGFTVIDALLGAAASLLERIEFPPVGAVAVPLPSEAARRALGDPARGDDDWAVTGAVLERYAERWIADGFLPRPPSGT